MGSIQEKKYRTKKGDCLIIRDAGENNAAGIIEINKEVISETFFMLREPDEGNYTLENTRSDIKNHLNNDSSLYIVAEIDGMLKGFLEFQNGGLRRTSHAGIFSMFIQKNYRQEGIGTALLQTLIGWAESNPRIEKVTLAVFSTNEEQ